MPTLLSAWYHSELVVGILVVLFVVISILMMLIVLIQRPQGGGLSEAFGSGSGGAGATAFGAKTGDALTSATIIIFLAFIGTAVFLNYAVQPPPPTEGRQVTSNNGAPAEGTPQPQTTALPPDTRTRPVEGGGLERLPPGSVNPEGFRELGTPQQTPEQAEPGEADAPSQDDQAPAEETTDPPSEPAEAGDSGSGQ